MPPLPTRPKARDRYRFYPTRTAASEQGTGVGFRCEEFRHRLDAEQFSLRLSASIDGGVPRGGAIQVRLSASNMRQPFERIFPIRIKVKSADVRGLVADLLP